jgi:hypothetical protein
MTGHQVFIRDEEYKEAIVTGEYRRYIDLFPDQYETIMKDCIMYREFNGDELNELFDYFKPLYRDVFRFVAIWACMIALKLNKIGNAQLQMPPNGRILNINVEDYDDL